MKKRHFIVGSAALATLLFAAVSHSNWWPFSGDSEKASSQQELTEIMWDDLIPDDFVQPENPFISMTQEEVDKLMDGSEESNAELAKLEEAFNYAPVVPELDGKRVRIPAYITPLEFTGQSKIREFLLVPYVGACMHTPPPPANQIVFAKTPEAIDFAGMYEPVWAEGLLSTESVQSELAETGYSLKVEKISPYTQQ